MYQQDLIVTIGRRCRRGGDVMTIREKAAKWYERQYWPYAADRNTVSDYAAWLKPVKWQLFCTFSFGKPFAKPVADEMANSLFAEFINRLEAMVKADLIYVRGDEKRFSGCGKPACGRHFHTVMASAAPLQPAVVEWLWKEAAGSWDDGADIQPYNPNLNGVAYVLKMMDKPYGDWTARKLHLVMPMSTEMLSRRERRNLRRHQARANLFANMKRPEPTPGGSTFIGAGQLNGFGQQQLSGAFNMHYLE